MVHIVFRVDSRERKPGKLRREMAEDRASLAMEGDWFTVAKEKYKKERGKRGERGKGEKKKEKERNGRNLSAPQSDLRTQ